MEGNLIENKENNVVETQKSYEVFAAINRYIETNIVSSKEEIINGRDFVVWGDSNLYAEYCADLCDNVTLLRTLINGFADYVEGEEISLRYAPWSEQVNKNGDTVEDIVRNMALDYARFGGFALNVIRNKMGGIAEIYYMDLKKLRSDKKNEFFYYSEDWRKSYGRCKYTSYPKFRPNSTEASSIFFYKNTYNSVYPQPLYAGDGLIAAEVEKSIQEYNLNSIHNGFAGNYIINFNNGVPTDDVKEEIEKNVNEKFCGQQNAGRLLVTFNNSKDNEITISRIDGDDFADRFTNLSKTCKQELYTSFRAQPVLFGLPSENIGFSDQDFDKAFALYNKTVILPFQKIVKRTFEKILGEKEVIQIKPFSIDWTEDAEEADLVS